MQQYLLRAGMRPINNVVDISNFVMLEMNQPLHTFDYQKLAGREIIVRAARPSETMRTLDGKERVLGGGEILICDRDKPVCIGGVMGGLETEVTADTVDVLIEAACFKPDSIRRTARGLGLISEASQRFEKGVDIAACDQAARRALQLLVQYCGASAAAGALDAGGQASYAPRQIYLRRERVNGLLGACYSMETILHIMRSLAFAVGEADADSATIDIPSYRQDITLEEDLIEEVARLLGYDSIPSTMPLSNVGGALTPEQRLREKLRDVSVGLGLYETINYSFISREEAEKLLTAPEHPWRRPLAIANPLTEEQSVMRLSLLPGLLNCARRNISRRNLNLALFELGSVYIPAQDDPAASQPREIAAWGLLLSGAAPASWQEAGRPYDYFSAKGLIEALAAAFHSGPLSFTRAPEQLYPYLHPGRSALVLLAGEELGICGELEPRAAANFDLPPGTVVAELFPAALFKASGTPPCAGLPKYPAMERDIALVGSADSAAAQIEAAIRKAGGPLLEQVKLFDVYAGPPIEAGQRSLAYALSFRAAGRTLTDAEADAAMQNIVSVMAKEYGLKLR
jgi:phenylalanyl-tRNA synthetase beta chain